MIQNPSVSPRCHRTHTQGDREREETMTPVIVAAVVADSATVTASPVVVASIVDSGPESATDTLTGASERRGGAAKEKPRPSLDALQASPRTVVASIIDSGPESAALLSGPRRNAGCCSLQ
jgi:hypothetical protein